MKKVILFIFAIAALQFSFAQHTERCANTFKHSEYLKENPEAKKTFNQIENQLQKIIQKGYTTRSTNQVYQIPLVIHVMHLGEGVGVGNNISDAQVMGGITQLNNAFRNADGQGIDTEIEFVLAKQDPNCNASTGIVRYDASGIAGYTNDGVAISSLGADEVTLKAASKWPNTEYYNIWIVSEIEGNNGGFGTQGYAYFPGTSSARDGTIIMNTAWGNIGTANSWNNQGKTGIHELGHGLNLYHTFNVLSAADTVGNGCPSNVNCLTEGDLCCDTDPHKVSASFSCTENETNECTGNFYGDVVHNYMDYSDQDCQYLFSQDQVNRMRATLEGPRASLLASKGLSTAITIFSEPTSPVCEPTTEATGLSAGYAGIMGVDFHTLSATSSYASNDGGYVNNADDCLKAVYVHPDSTYDLSITSWANTSYAKGWIDYNNDGAFDNSEMIYDQTLASKTTVSQAVTISNSAVEDQFLRMRLLLDLNQVTTSCTDPKYGQAEDYAVYIHKIYTVSGKIFEESAGKTESVCGSTGAALLGISLVKNGQSFYTTSTDAQGNYSFNGVTDGTYDMHIDSAGFDNATAPELTVEADVEDAEYIAGATSLTVCNNSTGVNKIEGISNLNVSPNPVSSNFILRYQSESFETLTYQLTDIQGRLVENGKIQGANAVAKEFNISDLNPGVYLLSVGNHMGTSTIQIIKK